MSNVDHNILSPDTLAALAALAQNMVADCKSVAGVKTSTDMIPALAGVVQRGHESGTVAHGDIIRKILAGASKSDVLAFMNQDKGTKGGKALASHIMRGLRAVGAKDNDSGRTVSAWLNDESLKWDADGKVFHFAPKTTRETLKTRIAAIVGEGSDDEIVSKVFNLLNKAQAALRAAADSEAKAKRLAAELAAAHKALQTANKANEASKAA